MTIITATAADVALVDDNTSWTFSTQQLRESDDGTIITTRKVRKYPIAGVLTVSLDPGPATVLAPDGKTYLFTVPEEDSPLWPLIQAAVTIPPGTRHDELVAAVDAWMEVNANAWDSIPGKPAFVAAGASAAAAREEIAAAKRITFNVDDYGADPTGATSSDTAITNARTAMGSAPGILEFGVGTYKFSTDVAPFGAYQAGRFQGRGQTILKYSGSGVAISARDTRTFVSFPDFLPGGSGGPGWGGELIGGFTLDGSDAGAGAKGLHVGDLTNAKIDAAILNFDGTNQIAARMHNQSTWSEKMDLDLYVYNCTKAVDFDGGTFDYGTKIQIALTLFPNQDGVSLINDVSMMGVSMRIVGGCVNGPTNTGTVLIVGKDNADGAHFRGHLDIDVEAGSETDNVAHKTIAIGNAASVVGYGSLHFYRRPSPIVPWTNGTGVSRMAFTGHIDVDDTFGRSLPLQGSRTIGLLTGARGYLDPSGDMYLDGGNWYAAQLTAGARTLNMIYASATLGYPQAASFDLFLQQPAAGAATVTWPAGFTWLDGAAPTLSTTPNAVDHIHVTTADFTTFYARHVNASRITGKTIDAAANTIRNATGSLLPVRVASTTGTYTISGGNVTQIAGTTVDGITPAVGERLLIFSAPAATGAGSFGSNNPGNGVYVVTGNTTNLTVARAADLSGTAHPAGMSVTVTDGSYAGFTFTTTTPASRNSPFTYGTGGIQWALTGAPDVATTWTPQTFLLKTLTSPKISSGHAPATATSAGTTGQVEWDSGFIYICTATNTWRRVAIASW